MELNELLSTQADPIVDEAVESLRKGSLHSYERDGNAKNRDRLAALYELMRTSIASQTLVPMVEYARDLARQRYGDGFDLQEMQTAFNVLEEVVWRRVTTELPPAEYARALGLVSTVLGAGKEALAVEYVSLASQHPVRSIDFAALFRYGQ